MTQFRAPTGALIVGTLERVLGTAQISGFERNSAGEWEPEYEGDTDIDWNSQESVYDDGKLQVVDEDGVEWDFEERTPTKRSKCRPATPSVRKASA